MGATTTIPGTNRAPASQAGDRALAPAHMVNSLWTRAKRKLRSWVVRPPAANDGWQPAHGPVMVVAPHPDDEVIGCGGTLRRHADAGDVICAVYLTRGESSRGYPWLTASERQATRVAEAKASCAILGVPETLFLDGVDGHCGDPDVAPALAAQLAAAIQARQPKVVYIPHADDNHPDHVAAYRLVTDVARGAAWRPEVYQYELWSPLAADFAVDVSRQMSVKIKAIKRHQLALDAFDYVPTIFGLAAYRSGTMLQRKGYAEAFRRTPGLYPA